MNIKVGDKVRIKTEEELLAEGWQRDGYRIVNEIYPESIGVEKCGVVTVILCVDPDDDTCLPDFDGYDEWVDVCVIAEVLPQTLDEYICSLPLEERAEKFILHFEGYGTLPYYSALTKGGYLHYDEALQATIEALKQPKE